MKKIILALLLAVSLFAETDPLRPVLETVNSHTANAAFDIPTNQNTRDQNLTLTFSHDLKNRTPSSYFKILKEDGTTLERIHATHYFTFVGDVYSSSAKIEGNTINIDLHTDLEKDTKYCVVIGEDNFILNINDRTKSIMPVADGEFCFSTGSNPDATPVATPIGLPGLILLASLFGLSGTFFSRRRKTA